MILPGMEQSAYAIAIGIDRGTNNSIVLSLQFSVSSDDTDGQSSSTETVSVQAANIDSGISLINSHIGKRVNLSHAKVIVISSELAYTGVSEYIYTLANNIQVRPNTNIIISRGNASDFLDKSIPTLEDLSARYYNIILNSSRYTGHSDNIELSQFYSRILDSSREASAILRRFKWRWWFRYHRISSIQGR